MNYQQLTEAMKGGAVLTGTRKKPTGPFEYSLEQVNKNAAWHRRTPIEVGVVTKAVTLRLIHGVLRDNTITYRLR